jgi:hypothetical protein
VFDTLPWGMAITVHDHLALVTLAEDVSWEEILRGSGIARHVVRALSPRAVILEPEAVDTLLTWLRRSGYLPKVVR